METDHSIELGPIGGNGRNAPRFSRLDEEDGLPYTATAMPVTPAGARSRGGGASGRRRWKIVGGAAVFTILVVLVGFLVVRKHGDDSPSSPVPPASCPSPEPRLPTNVTPTLYHVFLSPTWADPYSFTGVVSIDIDVDVSPGWGGCIQLHSTDLNIAAVSFNTTPVAFTDTTPAESFTLIPDYDRLMVALPDDGLHEGTVFSLTLHVSFSGTLNRNMQGLYLAQYTDAAGDTVPMVATQFEATSARRAFPCFDEPALKAEFFVTVTNVPDGYVARSNMAALPSPPVDAPIPYTQNTVGFKRSIKMSTYLVALIVGKMGSKTATVAGGMEVAVWAPVDEVDITQFALDTAVSIIPYYQDFFELPLPSDKMDLLAIPDFAAGAMENTFAITFRETALLADATTASQAALERVAVVICHEMTHQWFGDLVTIAWWDSLFLNEGFATFYEFKGVEHSHPEFNIYSKFHLENPQVAMAVDGYAASHPLSGRTVETSGQIEEMFDSISYSKGASIIYMVEAHLGPAMFRNGIAEYIEENLYGNTVETDLWKALTTTGAEPDLTDELLTYTTHPGVPLLTFAWVDASHTALSVTQSRFWRSAYSESQWKGGDHLWWIPLDFAAQTDTTAFTDALNTIKNDNGFTTASPTTTIPYTTDANGWFKANPAQTGYYRCDYPTEVWTALSDGLAGSVNGTLAGTEVLSTEDRQGLVDDAFAVAFASPTTGLTMPAVLDMLAFLNDEREYQVWVTALGHLHSLHVALFAGESPCADALGDYVVGLVNDTIGAIGLAPPATGGPEPVTTTLLRANLLSWASYYGHPEVIAYALKLWTDAAGVPANVPADLQSLVFRTVVREGDDADYATVYNAYLAETDPGTKRYLLRSLASSKSPTMLQQTLEYAIGPTVRSQDTVGLVDSVALNPVGHVVAWEFVKDHWSTFEERYGSGGFAISSLVSTVASPFGTQAKFNDVSDFFQSVDVSAAALEVEMALEAIAGRMQWVSAAQTSTCDKLTMLME